MIMPTVMNVRCDGCGQTASPEHLAQRLRRLEWATRYRPVHIQTLLLGGAAPREDADFLYSPSGEFGPEAGLLLHAVGISSAGKAVEAVHAEFQDAGFFLTHLLECPLEDGSGSAANPTELLREHLPAVAARIRRSLKPKRVMLVTEVPVPVVQDILALDLGCPVVLDDGKPFRFSSLAGGASSSRFRELLSGAGKS
jgi:hypothetical protein